MQIMKLLKNRKDSFHTRLFVCIFTTSFLLLFLGEIVLFSASLRESNKMNRELTISNIEMTQKNIEKTIDQVDTNVQLAFSQKGVLAATQADWDTNIEAHETLLHAQNVAIASNDFICHFSLCSNENSVICTKHLGVLPYSDTNSCKEYFDRTSVSVEINEQTWYFLQQHPFKSKEYAFSNVRKITPIGDEKNDLLLVATASESELAKVYSFLGDNSFIMTEEGIIVSATNKQLIGNLADDALRAKAVQVKDKGQFLFQKHDNTTFSVYLPSIGCYLIVNTTNSALTSTKTAMALIAVTVILVGLIFSLVWSKYIAGTLTKPIKQLRSVMEAARSGDLTMRSDSNARDEIGYLCESFNDMMDSLDGYVHQLDEQKELAKDNEIRLLQAQINPHLLYNTLDSALYLMSNNETKLSIRILETLSHYFKMALQRGNKIITIDAAIEHIEAYLELQNLCRMKNFSLKVTGDYSLLKAEILHMLIQPVVENSVLHGFEGSFADGCVEINLTQKDNRILICITDNGIGMDDLELEQLRNNINAPHSSGESFGMWNIVQRIKMYYGNTYGVQVDSEFGEYTSVTLEIPFKQDSINEE